MVLLTITAPILEALQEWRARAPDEQPPGHGDEDPSLSDPALGNSISHSQIIELRDKLRARGCDAFSLERLLVGSTVFVPPPPPKPEHTAEYKALMARLRRDEEARAYQRMVNPPDPADALLSPHRFSSSASARASSFAAVNRPQRESDMGGSMDDVTLGDVHRQLMLLLNFMLSIFGVAGTLWVVARWWSTPARLLLSMAGAVIVGIAEVGVYYFYVWHLADASRKDKKVKERKKVVQSWVVEAPSGATNVDKQAVSDDRPAVRRRKKA